MPLKGCLTLTELRQDAGGTEKTLPDHISIRLTGISRHFRTSRIAWLSSPDDEEDDLVDAGVAGDGEADTEPEERRVSRVGQEVIALAGINLDIGVGERVAVIGGSGSGKSTLMRVMARVTPPSTGVLHGRGSVIPLWALRAPIDATRSGRENLLVAARLFGLDMKRAGTCLAQAAQLAGLGERLDFRADGYSQSMFASFGLAFALAYRPDILLVDGGLWVGDDAFRQRTQSAFAECLDAGMTLVMSGTGLNLAQQYCTRAIWLHEGQVVADGDIGTVMRRYIALESGVSMDDILNQGDWETDQAFTTTQDDDGATGDTVHAGVVPEVAWMRAVRKAERSWGLAVQRKQHRDGQQRQTHTGTVNVVRPGGLAAMTLFRIVDASGHTFRQMLPGTDCSVEAQFDVYDEHASIRLRLEIEADFDMILFSEPLFPVRPGRAGRFLVRAEIPGWLFGNESLRRLYKFRLRCHVHPEAGDAVQQVNATVRVFVRGDIRSNYFDRLARNGWPVASVVEPLAGVQGADSDAGPESITAPMSVAQLLARKPALYARLEWQVFEINEALAGQGAATDTAGDEDEVDDASVEAIRQDLRETVEPDEHV